MATRVDTRREQEYEGGDLGTLIAEYLRDAETGRAVDPAGSPYTPAGLRSLQRALADVEAQATISELTAAEAIGAPALERLGRQIVDNAGLAPSRLGPIVAALHGLSGYAAGDPPPRAQRDRQWPADPPRWERPVEPRPEPRPRERPAPTTRAPSAEAPARTPTQAMLALGADLSAWMQRNGGVQHETADQALALLRRHVRDLLHDADRWRRLAADDRDPVEAEADGEAEPDPARAGQTGPHVLDLIDEGVVHLGQDRDDDTVLEAPSGEAARTPTQAMLALEAHLSSWMQDSAHVEHGTADPALALLRRQVRELLREADGSRPAADDRGELDDDTVLEADPPGTERPVQEQPADPPLWERRTSEQPADPNRWEQPTWEQPADPPPTERPARTSRAPSAEAPARTPTHAMLALGAHLSSWMERIIVIAFLLTVIGLALELV